MAASAVLRRSIEMLCVADHHNDPALLEPWLSNKTSEMFRVWLDTPGNVIIVAVDASQQIIGVAGLSEGGEITLNYVDPEARFRGVSTAMLDWLEQYLRTIGANQCRLTSSKTAYRFYLSRGYGPTGGAAPSGHDEARPMLKAL